MLEGKESFKRAYLESLEKVQGSSSTDIKEATIKEKYAALTELILKIIQKERKKALKDKEVYYLSMEFLPGKYLRMHLLNLGIWEICREGLYELGINIEELESYENDPGLGSGGLGRLAASFLDSLAALNLPGCGCGIRYEEGYFTQELQDGRQVEYPDEWLKGGNPWEIKKSGEEVLVKFGGTVKTVWEQDRWHFSQENYDSVLATPFDIPITGYKNDALVTLRLWSASEREISKSLYPDDSHLEGKILRLKQEYFLVSASIQDILRNYKKKYGPALDKFHQKRAIHINDTHPALAIPELMRILLDEERMTWDQAWEITTETFSFTNHTIMSEALEKWPVDIFRPLLPRIYMIIEEINSRLAEKLTGKPGQNRGMLIIADKEIKMAHLAIVGSYSVNGVSKLHSEILKTREMKDFHNYYPSKFNNKTNGINHRRWLLKANPPLSKLITKAIGPEWIEIPTHLTALKKYSRDKSFQEKLLQAKRENKLKLAEEIKNKYGLLVDPDSIFDIQIKRIHAYKRQILNILHIISLYKTLQEDRNKDIVPRTFIFSGKAAPNYHIAKLTIKLINLAASLINSDKSINDKLKVIFLENYNVTLAEKIFPAADVSEQISTAGKEASGTGNMKSILNGAVIIGTEDGANIEIKEEVGEDNIFLFGLTAPEVFNYYKNGQYSAEKLYEKDKKIKEVLDSIITIGGEQLRDLFDNLLRDDQFFVLKDFKSYAQTQQKVDRAYRDKANWLEMSTINIAHAGSFSSDRTVLEYAQDIWGIL